MRDRQLTTMDERAIILEANEQSERLTVV
jgi:hypothetical protein